MIGSVQEPQERPSVAAVTDALGRVLNHQANALDLVSPTPGRVLFGVAVTIRFIPYRDDLFQEEANSFARCFYAAIGNEPQGKVIVFDSAGYGNTSVGGGTKLSRLNNTGVAGLITNARLRNFRELAEYDPVFYCAGEAVRAGTAELMPSGVNVPVVLHGVTVVPGDYVYADSSGAVIIPATHFEEVWGAATEIETNEVVQRQSIREENPEDVNVGSREH
ncbi:RraA family protein [Mesorhizobium sp. M0408]|uniref:RraA family protein n=1 Tax=Mesorhizobium sp. M0408 TaxID=2956942 RepID=UPI00333958A9